ncbi:MAG: TIGR00341 family protein [Nanohaloarchaea archaeon SW_10_44_10]|nr:MAG: TIGR00341 family protein [Nanohaloarchaea archaeon SW_10_44_10]
MLCVKQLQVTVPGKFKEEVKEILEDYSSDVSVSEAEKNDEEVVEFHVTAGSDQIDDLSDELKDIGDLESGGLTINVIKQESQIRKGQKTKGGSSILSQAEIYSQAQEAAVFNRAEWSLVALSSIIATYGLIADNIIVVIGAMMVAPILSPFVSGALSLNIGDKKLLKQSLKTGSTSFLLAVLASAIAAAPLPVTGNPTLTLVSQPSIVSILLSVFVGAAATLTFVTGMRDEMAGVAVAIALIPPIASIGIGLKLADIEIVLNSFAVAGMNAFSIVASGFLCFHLLGIRPSTYYRKKQAEKIRYVIPVSLLALSLLAIPIAHTSYQSYQNYSMEEEIRGFGEEFFGQKLLSADINGQYAHFYVIGNYSQSEFEDKKPEGSNIQVTALKETG